MNQPYDRSAKWLIEHHGDGLLKLAAMPPIESWRAIANEEVAPRRTPDGLLEVKFADHPTTTPVIIEVESRSSADNLRQMAEDLFLVRLTKGVWPDAILLTLTGPEQPRVDDAITLTSAGGTSGVAVNWRTVRLWELEANDLFALGDVGIVPLIPLTRSALPPEELLARCRAEIDRNAPPDQRLELLVISRFLAANRYNDNQSLLEILLDNPMYTESPEITRLRNKYQAEGKVEATRENLLDALRSRFAKVPTDIAKVIADETDITRLKEWFRFSFTCEDLPAFINQIQPRG
ncbi:hypothetical protein [Zavarzinella formosa]|uniref:hypothetical protein n=1 Tax=Zavarzinella formosa TaxID=360055 RepID=UPI0002F42670|nr:hypothetical protein [Zavarzinella formosa]